MSSSRLHSYKAPPLAEVAISVQFDSRVKLKALDLPTIQTQFAKMGLTQVEEHPPLARMASTPVTVPGLEVALPEEPQIPRLWFLSTDGNRLVQFQADRLIVNWHRDSADDEYPRYKSLIDDLFLPAWDHLRDALESLDIQQPTMDVCELLYLNPIDVGSGWRSLREIGNVVSFFDSSSKVFPIAPDSASIAVTFPLPRLEGILIVDMRTAIRDSTGDSALILRIIGRGEPANGSIEGAMKFFDVAHEWIVKVFSSATATQMHDIWERER